MYSRWPKGLNPRSNKSNKQYGDQNIHYFSYFAFQVSKKNCQNPCENVESKRNLLMNHIQDNSDGLCMDARSSRILA